MNQRKINRVSVLLLLVGLGSAAVIYALAPPPEEDPWKTDPLGQKRYAMQLLRYGGKANQLSAEFLEWFDGLWHGQALGGTVAVLTLATTGMYRFVALRNEALRREAARVPAGGEAGHE